MALCVMTPGTTKMPQWCADNLDSLLMVCARVIIMEFIIIIVYYEGAVAVTREFFAESILPTSVSSVNCSSLEDELSDCAFSSAACPSPLRDAGVACQGL